MLVYQVIQIDANPKRAWGKKCLCHTSRLWFLNEVFKFKQTALSIALDDRADPTALEVSVLRKEAV